jgi:acyl-coenzyme A thioesterase PaaI-like protein
MVTLGEVFAETKGQRKLIAMMTATMMVMDDTKTQASPAPGGKA